VTDDDDHVIQIDDHAIDMRPIYGEIARRFNAIKSRGDVRSARRVPKTSRANMSASRSPLRRDDSSADNDWSPNATKPSRTETVRRGGGAERVVGVSCAGRPRYLRCAICRHSASQYGRGSASVSRPQFSQ
jgi:hypothetical protein